MPATETGRRSGVLVDWHDAKGFGFIQDAADGRRLFAHVSAFPSGRRPVAGRAVTYAVTRDQRGRPCAELVEYEGLVLRGRARSVGTPVALALPALFLLALAGLAVLGTFPVWTLAVYGVLSLVTFLAYAADKRAAVRRDQRVPESSLHLLALLGGWPGALVAQRTLRHKTIKQPFRMIFWVTVAANLAVLAWVGLSLLLGLPPPWTLVADVVAGAG